MLSLLLFVDLVDVLVVVVLLLLVIINSLKASRNNFHLMCGAGDLKYVIVA